VIDGGAKATAIGSGFYGFTWIFQFQRSHSHSDADSLGGQTATA